MVSWDGNVQKNKCLFIKAGPVCDVTLCQKSIYLAEQGGRSRPGLKNWVSGRLSPSALSQLGMRVLHHPTRFCDIGWAHGGKEQWGVVLSTSTFLVVRPCLLWFHLTHQLHMNKEEAPWWLLMIKAISIVHNIQEKVFCLSYIVKSAQKFNTCLGFTIGKFVKLRSSAPPLYTN